MEAVRFVSWKVVWLPGTLVRSLKLTQLTPEQRWMRYTLRPPASVEALQERLIWLAETALSCRFVGSVGGVVSGGAPPSVLAPNSSSRPTVARRPIPAAPVAG